MKRILVGLDGSEPSLRAVRFAAEIAEKFEAHLTLVTVVAPMLLPSDAYAAGERELHDENRLHGERALHDAAAEVPPGVRVERVLIAGSPADTLAELALAEDVWFVVVGRRGRSAVARVLLGSVSDRLVRICAKPVVVAH